MPERKKFLLRLDPEVFAAVKRWADDDFRSANAQMEYLLRDALRQAGRFRTATKPRSDALPDAGETPDDADQ